MLKFFSDLWVRGNENTRPYSVSGERSIQIIYLNKISDATV